MLTSVKWQAVTHFWNVTYHYWLRIFHYINLILYICPELPQACHVMALLLQHFHCDYLQFIMNNCSLTCGKMHKSRNILSLCSLSQNNILLYKSGDLWPKRIPIHGKCRVSVNIRYMKTLHACIKCSAMSWNSLYKLFLLNFIWFRGIMASLQFNVMKIKLLHDVWVSNILKQYLALSSISFTCHFLVDDETPFPLRSSARLCQSIS